MVYASRKRTDNKYRYTKEREVEGSLFTDRNGRWYKSRMAFSTERRGKAYDGLDRIGRLGERRIDIHTLRG